MRRLPPFLFFLSSALLFSVEYRVDRAVLKFQERRGPAGCVARPISSVSGLAKNAANACPPQMGEEKIDRFLDLFIQDRPNKTQSKAPKLPMMHNEDALSVATLTYLTDPTIFI